MMCDGRLIIDISIHPPRAGRDGEVVELVTEPGLISIHPPRAGRDLIVPGHKHLQKKFQSTRPVRGGTSNPGT